MGNKVSSALVDSFVFQPPSPPSYSISSPSVFNTTPQATRNRRTDSDDSCNGTCIPSAIEGCVPIPYSSQTHPLQTPNCDPEKPVFKPNQNSSSSKSLRQRARSGSSDDYNENGFRNNKIILIFIPSC